MSSGAESRLAGGRGRWASRLRNAGHLFRLTAMQLATRRYWLLPFAPLVWLAVWVLRLVFGAQSALEASAAQNVLIGVPLAALAVFLGVRIVAGEIDRGGLEMVYTVPGGAQRVWLAKLATATVLLAASEGLLAILVFVFFTPFPLTALYGALQAAVFYLVVAMGLGALFRSEVAGGMATSAILLLNGPLNGILEGANQLRFSPFFNPIATSLEDDTASEILAWTLQNRIGFALVILLLGGLAFSRCERREKMLSG